MTRALAIAALAAAPILAAQSVSMPAWWKYSHPEARTIIGADISAIINSHLGVRMGQEFGQMLAGLSAQMKTANVKMNAADTFQGIDRVLVSVPGSLETSRSMPPKAVVLIHGQLNLAGIRQMVGTQGAVKGYYRKTEIWRDEKQSAGKLMMAVIDPQTVMLGDEGSLRKSLDSQATGVHVGANPLFRRAAEMATQSDLWMVSAMPPRSLAGGNSPMTALFDSVGSFEMGVSLRQGLDLSVNFNHPSPASAAQMEDSFRGLIQLALSQQKDPETIALLRDRVQISAAGTQLQLAAAWTQPEIDSAIAQLRTQAGLRMGGHPARPDPRANNSAWPEPTVTVNKEQVRVTEVKEPEPQRPLKIRIMNAEGGTREIELTKK